MEASKYGDSQSVDIDWLESVPTHWDLKRLRFVINSNPVKSEVSDLEKDTIVSFVPMESVTDSGQMYLGQEKHLEDVYSGYTFFKDEDIVLAKITPCFENGKGAIASGLTNGIGFGTTEFHVLRAAEELDNRWLYYLTKSHPFLEIGAAEMFGAGGQKRVPESYIKNFRLGIPPKREQTQIGHFLDYKTTQIDRLIEKKKALIEKLNEQRISVITQAVTKGLNPDVPTKDSELEWLGDVPRHWEVIKLRYCTSLVTSGSRGWAKYFSDAGDIFLRITNLTRDSINLDSSGIKRVDLPLGTEGERTQTQSGDVLISITADLGSVAVIPEQYDAAYVSQHISLVRPELDKIISKWLAFSVFSHMGKAQLLGAGYGGTKQQLSLGDIKELTLLRPPAISEQESIISWLETELLKLNNMVAVNQKIVNKMEEYRTALITAAVTGKIDVRNVEIPEQGAA